MKPIERPSPNFDGRGEAPVDMLVLHYTGMPSAEAALERMCDPAARVSAHWCVDEDGTLYRLVNERERAWHAGVSCWRGATDVNARSIGIELVNPGHEFGYRAFPAPQMQALIALCRDILSRHRIPARNVVGHSDVAPARKQDPGELFNWQALADAGIGLEPPGAGAETPEPDVQRARRLLSLIGYCPAAETEAAFAAMLTAFQRHFHPTRCDGRLDTATMAAIESLTARLEPSPRNA